MRATCGTLCNQQTANETQPSPRPVTETPALETPHPNSQVRILSSGPHSGGGGQLECTAMNVHSLPGSLGCSLVAWQSEYPKAKRNGQGSLDLHQYPDNWYDDCRGTDRHYTSTRYLYQQSQLALGKRNGPSSLNLHQHSALDPAVCS